ncbi:16S rRNA (guanine966-N2)-methyltransferase [Parvularcula dongshanensis]|uniref:16S rRNA (Guanine966-N2)-methyltransferase n=1 Tax=Parvularcula dongshanensis TaxID=1173995 RepID=A0A840I283_9PROT|nr:16S rRNA (guanine966-N2)-methyltransferase [Parvularcula dongshanensis]
MTGGSLGGRPLRAPKGMGTRPTTDRTREALFNILAHREDEMLEGARVLDLFAGSGALGIEAISRGAAFCLFVETAAAARGAIRENCEALSLNGVTRLHRRSATQLGAKPAGMGGPFSLAFLDPPYGQDLVAPTLAGLSAGGWLGEGALIVAEQGRNDAAPETAGFVQEDERGFGDTLVRFLRYGR